MKYILFILTLEILASCSSNPTREVYCQSLSTDKPLAEMNILETAERAYKRQKSYCEPDVTVTETEFVKNYNEARKATARKDCSCEAIVFKAFDKGFGAPDGRQTQESWSTACESLGFKHTFDKGVRAGVVLKKQLAEDLEIIRRIGYSSDQIKESCQKDD